MLLLLGSLFSLFYGELLPAGLFLLLESGAHALVMPF